MVLQQLISALKSLLTWWVTVAPWEQAVRVRMGKHVTMLGPGIHLRLPLFDRIYQQSTRRRFSSLPPQTLVTLDRKPLTVAVTVAYQIADLLLLYNSLHHAEGTIQAEVLGAVGRVVTAHRAEECGPGVIADEAAKVADLERYGLKDISVTVTSYAFVRTYRLITGEGGSWQHADHLDTSRETGVNS